MKLCHQITEGLILREGKNQEDLIGSEMDLLCEPDMSGLLADLLCTQWTSSGPATSIILPPHTSGSHRRSIFGPDIPLLVFTL